MNERIRELAEQAGIKLPDDSAYNGHIYRNSLERFANLIVAECADIVADAVDYREPASTYVGKIKQHFGVEPDVDENLRNRSTYFRNDI
jgi:hypothetical protein